MLKRIFLGKTRDEWLEIFSSQGIPVAPVQTIDEFMDYSQVIADDMIRQVDEGRFGNVDEMGIPVTLAQAPGKIKGPSPAPGQHTREILSTLGYTPHDITRLTKEKIVKTGNRRK